MKEEFEVDSIAGCSAVLEFRDDTGRIWRCGAVLSDLRCDQDGQEVSPAESEAMNLRLVAFKVITK